jgi:hypothetical protein
MSKHVNLTLEEVNALQVGDFLKENESYDEQEPPYWCQNPMCHCGDKVEYVHLYEIDSENFVVICNSCYDEGFRFCIYTHDVLHQTQLQPVLVGMYARPEINNHQLDIERLDCVVDLSQYLKLIGIDNHDPEHTIFQIKK